VKKVKQTVTQTPTFQISQKMHNITPVDYSTSGNIMRTLCVPFNQTIFPIADF